MNAAPALATSIANVKIVQESLRSKFGKKFRHDDFIEIVLSGQSSRLKRSKFSLTRFLFQLIAVTQHHTAYVVIAKFSGDRSRTGASQVIPVHQTFSKMIVHHTHPFVI